MQVVELLGSPAAERAHRAPRREDESRAAELGFCGADRVGPPGPVQRPGSDRAAARRRAALLARGLRHAIDGDLQAVLDEHAHMLFESECAPDAPAPTVAQTLADAIRRALGLRSSRVNYSKIDVHSASVTSTTERLHTAFAMRFGDEEGGGDRASGQAPARAAQLREAFNSPYWPFVLVSTAVGQEGLDFHPYCHIVVHWNLPTNPVDLEQREGRVHRFKGHAIRKNVARRHGVAALSDDAPDPWSTAFTLAAGDRRESDSELVPFWIYPDDDGAAVERQILALPLSRELDRMDALRNALAIYRLSTCVRLEPVPLSKRKALLVQGLSCIAGARFVPQSDARVMQRYRLAAQAGGRDPVVTLREGERTTRGAASAAPLAEGALSP
ncbi:MAG: helicase-related protein [Thermoleophilaceae bacterium]